MPDTSQTSFCPLHDVLSLRSMQKEELDGVLDNLSPGPSFTR